MKRCLLAILFLVGCSSNHGSISNQLAGLEAGAEDAGKDAGEDSGVDASIDTARPPSTFCESLPDGGQKCWECPPSAVPTMCDAGTD